MTSINPATIATGTSNTYDPNLYNTYVDTTGGNSTITTGGLSWVPMYSEDIEKLTSRLDRLEKLVNMPVRDAALEKKYDWLKETGDTVDAEMATAIQTVLSAIIEIGNKYNKALQDAEMLDKLDKNNE
jgi:hypothetical protein